MNILNSDASSRSSHTPSTSKSAPVGSNEVTAKATRRRFTQAYKRKIVTLATGLPPGEIGALLRREGLYASHLTHWRQFVARLDATMSEPKRGRKPDPRRPEKLMLAKLERDNARLHKRLAQAEAIIDAQKKLCALLGLPSNEELP
jgi:transposase